MVKPIVKDILFLGQKSVPATPLDMNVVNDLRDTLAANRERCVGMAANMIGYKKNMITIRATTAGRIPLNTGDNMELFLIISGVRKIAMASIMKNEGRIVPNAAQIDPFTPLSLSPTATEILTARIPGNDCATASKSRNSSRSSQ